MSYKAGLTGWVFAAALACGGGETAPPPAAPVDPAGAESPEAPAPGPGGNRAACEAYIAHSNGVSCMTLKLDASTICSPQLDQMPCDLAPYFNCLAENTKCNGALPDIAGQASCGQATCKL
jgi:hypothetical protein